MFMFSSNQQHSALLCCINGIAFPFPPTPTTSPFPPKPNPLFHPPQHYYPSSSAPFSLPRFTCCTNDTSSSSDSPSSSFAVSYLVHNFGFSLESANKLCSTYDVRFKTAENPDSVLSFFKNHGFSDSQLGNMFRKVPELLSCNPNKRVLPKFQFLLSKGASTSDIVDIVSKNPRVLRSSLENQIAPAYELIYRFMQSDEDTIALLNYNPDLVRESIVARNIKMLIENEVGESNIARLLRNRSSVLNSRDMLKIVEELKDLGFHPSKSTFAAALLAKLTVSKTRWKEKEDAFKKWGWSDEDILEAFLRQPRCMLLSVDKINLLMSFWVNHLGWDALALAKRPSVIGLSMEGRIIPRAAVVQFLLNKGLRKKNASLTYPFTIRDDKFLDRFIKRFKEESSYLLKLYEEKLDLANTRDKADMS